MRKECIKCGYDWESRVEEVKRCAKCGRVMVEKRKRKRKRVCKWYNGDRRRGEYRREVEVGYRDIVGKLRELKGKGDEVIIERKEYGEEDRSMMNTVRKWIREASEREGEVVRYRIVGKGKGLLVVRLD